MLGLFRTHSIFSAYFNNLQHRCCIFNVFNVEFPEIPEQYIHRIGRTGRADKSGIAISLISPREEEIMIEAEVLMEKEIDFIEMPEGIEIAERLLEFEKDKKKKMKFLMKKPKLEGNASFHEKIAKNKKVNLNYCFFKKRATI